MISDEFVRCTACWKLVRRTEAVTIDGAFYGRSCAKKILAVYRATHRPT